jgi:hypothetical protein
MIRSTGEIVQLVQVTLETNGSNHEKAKGPDSSEPVNPYHGALQISSPTILLSLHLIVRRILLFVPPLAVAQGHAHA